MDTNTVLIVTTVLFGWGLVSGRLQRAALTAPIVFVAAGAVLAWAGLVDGPEATQQLTPLVEVTLVWLLYSDAARLPLTELRRGIRNYLRLLGIGLPLTILLGSALAIWFFPESGLWLALLVGAALAPTDAALGGPIVMNPRIPQRIRDLMIVESGLNDGIATPVVMLAITGAATAAGLSAEEGVRGALVQLALGVVIGAAIGAAGGWLLREAGRKGASAEEFTGIAVLALAVLVYAAAVFIGGNGFVAAFLAGIAFRACAGRRAPDQLVFLEHMGSLVSLLVWMAFGAIAIPVMFERLNAVILLYAVLSLTIVRVLPVAVASIGAGLGRATILFVGWFGPRGLASLVFGLLALETLGDVADEAVAVIAVTVLLSVVAHGFSAAPLSRRYERSAGTLGKDEVTL